MRLVISEDRIKMVAMVIKNTHVGKFLRLCLDGDGTSPDKESEQKGEKDEDGEKLHLKVLARPACRSDSYYVLERWMTTRVKVTRSRFDAEFGDVVTYITHRAASSGCLPLCIQGQGQESGGSAMARLGLNHDRS